MPDRLGGRELARVERVGHQLERDRTAGQRRRLVHQLLAVRILDPELAQIGSNSINCAFKEPFAFAVSGFIH